MEREYFCMMAVLVKTKEGPRTRMVERVIWADPDALSTQDLFYLACEEIAAYLKKYERFEEGDFEFTGFSFYPNQLPR